jgi:hypothetical protein
MASASEVLTQRFLNNVVAIDQINMTLMIPNGHAHPLERSLSLRITAIEQNAHPELPLRESVYTLDLMEVSGLRMELPAAIEETTLDMDVDDVSLHQRDTGIHTLKFENGHATIEIDFRQVIKTVVMSKECAT